MNPINGFLAACLLILGILIIFVNASAHLKIEHKDNNNNELIITKTNLKSTENDNSFENSHTLFAQNSQTDEASDNSGSNQPVVPDGSDKSAVKPGPQDDSRKTDNDEDLFITLPMAVFNLSFMDSFPDPVIDIDEEQIQQSLKIAETVLANFDSSFFEQFNFQFDSLILPNLDNLHSVHFDSNCFKQAIINLEKFDFKFDTTNFNKVMRNLENIQVNFDTTILKKLENLEINFDSTKFKEAFEKLENIHIELDTTRFAQMRKELENIQIEIDTLKLQKIKEQLEKERVNLEKVQSEVRQKMEKNREIIEKELAQHREELEKSRLELEKMQKEKLLLEEEKLRRELEKQQQEIEKAYENHKQD